MTYDTAKIDRLVAERVKRWPIAHAGTGTFPVGCIVPRPDGTMLATKSARPWKPSEFAGPAIEALESFTDATMEKSGELWTVCISGAFTAENRSLPLAISLAALKAVGVDIAEVEKQ